MTSLCRPSGQQFYYPNDMSAPFPKFGTWLNGHVWMLKEENFPVSSESELLHCLPSSHELSFQSMWAYGAHYSCNNKTTPNTVAFDFGIATIPPSPTCTENDVEILRNIILFSYLGFNCVLMEGSWINSCC